MARTGPKAKPIPPTPLAGRPDQPAGLDRDAAEHWEQIVGMMERAGALSRLDGDALSIYIDAWSRFRQARSKCRFAGWVIEGKYGPRKSPWYAIMQDAAKTICLYADRFGLSPRARRQLKIDPAGPPDDGKWAGFGIVD